MNTIEEENTPITVERDDAPDISFLGVRIAGASSSGNSANPEFSGSVGRRTLIRLYRTKAGKFVCERIERSNWQGERDQYDAHVCDNISEIFNFFGHGWLAKSLYAEAGISAVVEVE
ncbi:hypothetical protein [Rhizobium ruizarguesonis]|uniref:hypothetical protein n=1 Tax=Rhizobium ruizarguesonis TaxID=2081791 RepID=UPI001CF284B2|nr:hypothetical protein [Rhizobium ruizarguesonis]MCB2403570.1 hypothetical protein [Rhizobium ruizarguesonis]